VSRDGLPRAYLRIDPNVDQVYPELRNTFVGLLCSGHRQPHRGRYRDRRLVEALHSKPFVRRCYERGWDEWQEGDLTVADRMRRMRDRRRQKRNGVTDQPSPARHGVTTDAVAKGSTSSSSGVSDSDSPPNPPQSGGRNSRANGTNRRAREQAAHEAEMERRRMKRAERIASETHARRLESWRHTGKWETDWGPEPDELLAVTA
jgi:hypothetical protein